MSQAANASCRLATFLFEEIKKINPKAKQPNLKTWAQDIEKLIRIDGRSEEEVRKVIHWVFQDDFWCKNILSGRKLREKFDQLYINVVKHKTSPKKQAEDAAKQKSDLVKRNQGWAKDYFKDGPIVSGENRLTLKDNGVEVKFNRGFQIIGFLEHGFADQVRGVHMKMTGLHDARQQKV